MNYFSKWLLHLVWIPLTIFRPVQYDQFCFSCSSLTNLTCSVIISPYFGREFTRKTNQKVWQLALKLSSKCTRILKHHPLPESPEQCATRESTINYSMEKTKMEKDFTSARRNKTEERINFRMARLWSRYTVRLQFSWGWYNSTYWRRAHFLLWRLWLWSTIWPAFLCYWFHDCVLHQTNMSTSCVETNYDTFYQTWRITW